MTKLIVSSGTLLSGGAERVLSVLSKAFVSNYDEVIYLTWIEAPDFYALDKRIKRVCVEKKCESKNLLKKTLWFRRYIRQEKPSLVLSFLEPFNVLICTALIGVNVPVVVANRNDPRHVWGDPIRKVIRAITYKKAVGNLCQTENNMNYFSGSLLKKSYVIYNPIFLPEEYRGKALCTNKEKRIVSVARLDKQKNLTMMVDSFEEFHKTHIDYKMTIYGGGPLKAEIEMYIKNKGLSDVIETPGPQSDVWDKILNAECFALSSWFEGMPNALLEAMCLGLPCVSTKVSGAVDLIESGKNGYLVDLDDRAGMALALSKVIDYPRDSILMGKEATKLYDLLRQDIICKQWIDYLDGIIDKHSK